MKIKYLILYSLVLFTALSCGKQMETTIIEQNLEEFDTLTLNSVFDVELIQGTDNSIKIEAAAKILEKIDVQIQNNTLTIINNYKGNWVHPKKNKIKLFITVNEINKINANETCNIHSSTPLTGNEIGLIMTSKLNEASLMLNCNTFYYWNNFPCGGKVTLSGNVNELKLWNVALMAIDAQELSANDVTIENASKGDCYIRCLQQLNYSIIGEGNIYVSGNPLSIIKEMESSTGKLIIQ